MGNFRLLALSKNEMKKSLILAAYGFSDNQPSCASYIISIFLKFFQKIKIDLDNEEKTKKVVPELNDN